MKIINTDRGIIVMADAVDFLMWRAQKAWELASRIIPEKPQQTGAWTEAHYLEKAQQEIEKAYEIVNTAFKAK